MQLGVRYALVFVPALCLLLGAVGTWEPFARRPGRAASAQAGLAALLGADLVRNGPDWLAYFNAASGGQARAHHHFRDTNNDYGQQAYDEALLAARLGRPFTKLHPLAGARFGVLVVRVNWLARREPGADHPRFDWILCGEPLARLGAAWLAFEVTPEALEARLSQEDRADLRYALGVAHLGAGAREEARRVLAPLALPAEDPLAKLLSEPELAPEEAERAWMALRREDLLSRTPSKKEFLQTILDDEEGHEGGREILPGMRAGLSPWQRQKEREAFKKLLE
jgi:hypothetical protein